MARPRKRTTYGIIETWSPLGLAVITLGILLVLQNPIVDLFTRNDLSLPQLYTAIFGWASVMTGFQFGVYGLIFSKNDGFISQILTTKAMDIFMSYTAKAVKLGFLLTILGVPFLISNTEMKNINNIMYWLGAAYFSLFIYSFAATVRVARLFASMSRIKTRKSLPA